eukprot:1196418-Prorocentrum_minimum.AAC.5
MKRTSGDQVTSLLLHCSTVQVFIKTRNQTKLQQRRNGARPEITSFDKDSYHSAIFEIPLRFCCRGSDIQRGDGQAAQELGGGAQEAQDRRKGGGGGVRQKPGALFPHHADARAGPLLRARDADHPPGDGAGAAARERRGAREEPYGGARVPQGDPNETNES